MSIREAREILNVQESASAEEITAAFKRIYELNAPDKGNSFYLQSKAFRAHETLVASEPEPKLDEDGEPKVDKKEESNVSSK